MTLAVSGAWVVAHDRRRHVLLRDATVVTDGDRIVSVGSYQPRPGDERLEYPTGLVCPGFIDTHVHTSTRAASRLISDTGRPDYLGQPYLHWGISQPGQPNPEYFGGDRPGTSQGERDRLAAEFTAAELLLNGITTFVEFGSVASVLFPLAETCRRLGLRAYMGPSCQSGRFAARYDGSWERAWHEDGGRAQLEQAVRFVADLADPAEPLLRGLLVPSQLDLCSEELLRQVAETAERLDVAVAVHAAYSLPEWVHVTNRHRCTPVELLDRTGLLRPRTIVGHANLAVTGGQLGWTGGRDLELIARGNASVSHCPVNLVRRGRTLDSFGSYRRAGVRVTLGCDTYPRDMISQMRGSSYLGKVMDGDYGAATAAEVFEACTSAAADALGRPDLGRLAPGARADITVVDLAPPATLRTGPAWDPIKTMVETGIGDDVTAVIVAGRLRMRDRRIPGVDLAELRAASQAAVPPLLDNLPEWDPLGRRLNEMCPWSMPVVESLP